MDDDQTPTSPRRADTYDGTEWIAHCINRARERYDVDLTEDDLYMMLALIGRRKARVLRRDRRDYVMTLMYKGREYVLVYSSKFRRLKTFVPPGPNPVMHNR